MWKVVAPRHLNGNCRDRQKDRHQEALVIAFLCVQGPGRLPKGPESWLQLGFSKLQHALQKFLSGSQNSSQQGMAWLMLATCFLQEQSRQGWAATVSFGICASTCRNISWNLSQNIQRKGQATIFFQLSLGFLSVVHFPLQGVQGTSLQERPA